MMLAPPDEHVALLWVQEVRDLLHATEHDVRNVMQGVAVNLEVVRTRLVSDKPQVESALKFATRASGSFDQFSSCVIALWDLLGDDDAEVDMMRVLRSGAALLAAGGRHSIRIDGEVTGGGAPLSPLLVRLALVHALRISALGSGRDGLVCRGAGAGTVEFTVGRDVALSLRTPVAEALRGAMVGVTEAPGLIRLGFPVRVRDDAVLG